MARKGSEVRFVAQSDFEYTLRIEPSLYPKVLQVLAEEVRAARKAFCEA
jgi:predicted ATPase